MPVFDGQFESSAEYKVDVGHPTAQYLRQSAKSSDERLQEKSKLPPNVALDLDSRTLPLKTNERVDLAPRCESTTTINASISELSIALDLERLHIDEPSEPPASIDSVADADTVLSNTTPPPPYYTFQVLRQA